MPRILLVEDDSTIVMGLVYSLTKEEMDVTPCYDAASALAAVRGGGFDLALLDLSLPDGNGYDICRAIKEQGNTPVIFLTARDDEASVVMGLDMGADDYVTKPFRLRELISRIRTVLRRAGSADASDGDITLGDVVIHTRQAKVRRAGTEIQLTALEYRLLLTLVQSRGRVLSRSLLLEGIWDAAGNFVNDNTLSVYIKRLREKLGDDPDHPAYIRTMRGLGYSIGE